MTPNYQVAIAILREMLGLPPHASCAAVVAKVRELIASDALAKDYLRRAADMLEAERTACP